MSHANLKITKEDLEHESWIQERVRHPWPWGFPGSWIILFTKNICYQRGGYDFSSSLTEPFFVLEEILYGDNWFCWCGTQLHQPMHTFLDKLFHIYILKAVCVETEVKYLRPAIFFALLMFWEVAERSSSGMSKIDIFFFSLYHIDAMEWITTSWSKASYVCLHWRCVSERSHAWDWWDIFTGASFEWDIFFVFSIAIGKCIRTHVMGI